MNLEIGYSSEENTHYLQLKGEVDAYTAPELQAKILHVTAMEGNKVIVDLSNVEYMDSTGLGVFVGALKSAKKHNSCLVLKNLTKRIHRLFKITGLEEIIPIQTDVKGEIK